MTAADATWMRLAIAEASRGLGGVEPNPLVGAVIVKDAKLVAVGHHARFGGPHAEVVALDRAGLAAVGATLYVTLEPCRHHGKTPPCTEAILQAGILRVVAAMSDPDPRVAGAGFTRLRDSGLAVEVGLGQPDALALNAPYLKRLAIGRPYVIAKWAMTLDGKVSTASGHSRWISNPRSRMHVHELRGRVDAVVIGIGTALADDPLLTARPPGPRVARRVVLDSTARLPVDSQLVRTAALAPVLVATTTAASPERIEALRASACEVIAFPADPVGRVAVGPVLDELGRRGATNVLLEGGGLLLGAFLDAGEIDAVDVFLAPRIEGGDHPRTAVRGTGSATMLDALPLVDPSFQFLDGDLRLTGHIARPWRRIDLPTVPA